MKNPRIKKIIIHSAGTNTITELDLVIIYYTSDIIASENCCGIVHPWYFKSNTESFIEAKQFNSCLNKKVSVDKFGEIKNCPSMETSFGNILCTSIEDIVDIEDFQHVFKINKDQIETCSDCEYRFICQDCRAYLQEPTNKLSKPLKCNYDPYQGKWL